MAIEASLALLAILLFFVLKLFSNKTAAKLPPGPRKLPVIGNMNQLLGRTPPHLSLRELANKHGPLMHLQLGQVGAVVVSDAETAREVMKTHDLVFSSRPKVLSADILGYGYTDIGFAPYGPYWRQMRKICVLELLSTSRVQSFRSAREEEVALMVSSIAAAAPAPVDMTQKLFALGHDVTSRIAFGRKNTDPKRFREIAKEGVALAGGFDIADFFPSLSFVRTITGMKSRLERAFLDFDRILDDIIESHRRKEKAAEPTEYEDIVDVLLRVQANSDLEMPLTEDNIKAVILDLFLGGSETTSITLEAAMVEMMRNPEVMVKARAEITEAMEGKTKMDESDVGKLTYLKSVINEALRLHPPLPLLIPRESTERCTIDGYEIPAKTRVIINNWAISRDPCRWERADTFYPERFSDCELNFKAQSYEYLPFGGGRRGCPGILFAMNVLEYALANLLYYFDWKLPEGVKPEDLEVGEIFGLTVTRESNLRLIPIPRFKTPTTGTANGIPN